MCTFDILLFATFVYMEVWVCVSVVHEICSIRKEKKTTTTKKKNFFFVGEWSC